MVMTVVVVLLFGRLLDNCGLGGYIPEGRTILEVPTQNPGESFTAWIERVGNPFDQDWEVMYQMPLLHEGVRGIRGNRHRATAVAATS